jgi:hypothetical protein
MEGKKTYVIKKGIIQWGLTTWVLWSTWMFSFNPSKPLWLQPLIGFILFPIGGIFFGLFTWKHSEKMYAKHTVKS